MYKRQQLYRTARSEVVTEAALIATCNRTELYAWVDSEDTVSYTHLRAHETVLDLVCRLLLEKKKSN